MGWPTGPGAGTPRRDPGPALARDPRPPRRSDRGARAVSAPTPDRARPSEQQPMRRLRRLAAGLSAGRHSDHRPCPRPVVRPRPGLVAGRDARIRSRGRDQRLRREHVPGGGRGSREDPPRLRRDRPRALVRPGGRGRGAGGGPAVGADARRGGDGRPPALLEGARRRARGARAARARDPDAPARALRRRSAAERSELRGEARVPGAAPCARGLRRVPGLRRRSAVAARARRHRPPRVHGPGALRSGGRRGHGAGQARGGFGSWWAGGDRDRGSGLLFDPREPRQLALHLTRLVEDPDLRRRLGRAARERASAFAVERTVAEVTAIWRELLPLRL